VPRNGQQATRVKKRHPDSGQRRTIREVGLNAATAVLQTSITLAVPTPEGQLVAAGIASAIGDLAKRILSPREEDRVEEVIRLAAEKIRETEKSGTKPRGDLEPGLLEELAEGTLLAAKDTYEKKKLPFLATLLSNGYFFPTPVPNLLGALHAAEELTYRQLCILATVWPYDSWEGSELTNRTLNDVLAVRPMTEDIQGIIFDLVALLQQHLVMPFRKGQYIAGVTMAELVPAELRQTYPGRVIFFGMKLDDIPAEDRDEILRVLGANGLAQSKQP